MKFISLLLTGLSLTIFLLMKCLLLFLLVAVSQSNNNEKDTINDEDNILCLTRVAGIDRACVCQFKICLMLRKGFTHDIDIVDVDEGFETEPKAMQEISIMSI